MGVGKTEKPKGNIEASQRSGIGESHCILLAREREGEGGASKTQRKGHLQNLELQRSRREEPPRLER